MLFTSRAGCSADHDRPPSRATPDPHPRQAQCQTFQETPAQLDLIASPTVPGSTTLLIVQFQFNIPAFSSFSAYICRLSLSLNLRKTTGQSCHPSASLNAL